MNFKTYAILKKMSVITTMILLTITMTFGQSKGNNLDTQKVIKNDNDRADKYEQSLVVTNYLVKSIPDKDFLTVDYNTVVFISPDSKKIAEMKKENEEDFYTGANDQNFYQSEGANFFKSKNLKVLYPTNRYIKFETKSGEIYFDTKAKVSLGWTELMFRTDSLPKIFNVADYEIEYKNYFGK